MTRTEPVPEAPGWVTSAEPVPIRLMNTIWADRNRVHDSLNSRSQLVDWLQIVGFAAQPLAATADDVATGRNLRDALRRLAALLTEDTRLVAGSATDNLSAAVRQVNVVASTAAGPRLRLNDGVLARDVSPQSRSVGTALAAIAAESIDLLTGTTAALLRACYAPGCVVYFVKDHPRREWCSSACGNRVRAARHYARHHPTAAGPGTAEVRGPDRAAPRQSAGSSGRRGSTASPRPP